MEIIFYRKLSGEAPVAQFLDTLNPKLKNKTLRTIALLKSNGNNLGHPYSRPLEDGIFELRTQLGNDIDRIMYFFYHNDKAILTNGFIKKTQKTPKRELELAKKYKADYLRRNSHG